MADDRHDHIVERLRQNIDLSHLDPDQVEHLATRVGDLAVGMWVPDDYAIDAVTSMLSDGLDRARRFEDALSRLGDTLGPAEPSLPTDGDTDG